MIIKVFTFTLTIDCCDFGFKFNFSNNKLNWIFFKGCLESKQFDY